MDAPTPVSDPTVSEVLNGYTQERTQAPHSRALEYSCKAIERHLGDLPVRLLGRAQVAQYIAARRKEGPGGASARHRTAPKPLSDGTLIRELGVLRRAAQWAVEEGWIATAPKIERPPAPPPRERWLTHQEAEKLLAAAQAAHIKVFIALALWTAARTTALLELTWDRVDLDGRVISLGAGRGRKRRATVPIVDDLHEVLTPAHAAATSSFVVEFAGAPVASIKTGFRAAAARAGLKDVTPTVCRHTAPTWMVQRGISTAMVARWLGNTEAMIEKV